MNVVGFFRGLQRELRSAELVWLFAALILSVAALSSVGFLSDRMQSAFQLDARQLLASDLLLASDHPIDERFIQEAQNRNLEIAQTVVFPSMGTTGIQSKLVSLKAVSSTYPLRGNLQIDRPSGGGTSNSGIPQKIETIKGGPKQGFVWVDSGLLASLNAKVGDEIAIGKKHFQIDAVLARELDRGVAFMNFAPRVMMALSDLPSTELIGLGSRVTYRLLLTGSDKAIGGYEKWVTEYIAANALHGLRMETLETAQPTMRKTLDRAERFLSLIALLAAIVSAVAISLAARRYVLKQADACAVMKCFGASQRLILQKQFATLASLGFVAAVAGSVIGWLVQNTLVLLLGNLVLAELPEATLWPVIWSVLLSWFLLIGFAGPPLFGLVLVSPIRLVRKEFGGLPIMAKWVALFGIGSCVTLIFLLARDWRLAGWVILSFGGAVLAFSLLAWGALLLLGMYAKKGLNGYCLPKSFAFRFASKNQSRRSGFAVIQISALAIALMALLIILLLRQDLLPSWQNNIPKDAPNHFVINIQSDQKSGVAQILRAAGLEVPAFYPMVRGRLVDVNGRSISPDDYADDNARRLVDREFNLSYAENLPPGNRIVSGAWFGQGNSNDEPQISIETGIAKTLGLKLGDRLKFEVAGEGVSAPITSLRKLDWGSMRVNFFVIMPSALLKNLPQSWITAYFQPSNFQALNTDSLDFRLTQTYPNLTVIDVATTLQQIQEVLDKLAQALGLLFAFTIAAAILVLMAALSATQDERFRDAALLKALGAPRSVLARIAAIELGVVGLLAGCLAGLGSGAAAWALGRFVLEIEFNSFAEALVLGIGFGLLACILAGYRFHRKVQSATAIDCLREI